MTRLGKCGIYATYNVIQPQRRRKLFFAGKWIEMDTIILSDVNHGQEIKGQMSSCMNGNK
jgi:hypothetical protein